MWLCLSDEGRNHMKVMWQNIYKLGYEKMRQSKSSDLRNDSTVKEGKGIVKGKDHDQVV